MMNNTQSTAEMLHRKQQQRQQQEQQNNFDSSSLIPSISSRESMRLPLMMLALALSMGTASAFSEVRTLGTYFYATSVRTETRKYPSQSLVSNNFHHGNSLRAANTHQIIDVVATSDDTATISCSGNRWWKPAAIQKHVADEALTQQAKIDEYLAYLDKRYHHLHDDDKKDGEVTFSALNWLIHGNGHHQHDDAAVVNRRESLLEEARERTEEMSLKGSSTLNEALSRRDDALYVLGVAGLASKELLNRRTANARATSGPYSVKRTRSDVSVSEGESASSSSKVLNKVAPLIVRLSKQRRMLLQYQSQQVAALCINLVRALTSLPAKAGRAILQYGGGKKTMAVTMTVAASLCFFLVKPLAQAVVSEGSRM